MLYEVITEGQQRLGRHAETGADLLNRPRLSTAVSIHSPISHRRRCHDVKTTRRSTGQGSSRPEFRFNNNPYVVQELRWKDSPRTDYDGVIADSPLPFRNNFV